jgi:branched-chain amino acid transport system substrate-binding protein
MDKVTRRKFLGTASLAAAGTAMGPWVLRARAQSGPIKIGVVLPYTGVYAVLGESITQAMELVFARENWTVAGRKIEMIKEDDEMKPPVGVRKTEKLIDSDKVDILTGPVHSGILMGMRDKVHNSKTILIVSNAGADAISRERCSKWIFRTSFSNWQPCQPMGGWVAKNVEGRVLTAQLPGGQGHDERLQGDLRPGRRQGGGRRLSEAGGDGLRALPDQDPPVGREGGLRLLLGLGRGELRQAVAREGLKHHQAHRRASSPSPTSCPPRARRHWASSPGTSTRPCSTTPRTTGS